MNKIPEDWNSLLGNTKAQLMGATGFDRAAKTEQTTGLIP